MTRWLQFQLLMPMEKEVAKTSVQIVLTVMSTISFFMLKMQCSRLR